jgi:hypothetical protein
MNSSELIQAIENDKSSSYWLIDQIRLIGKRDIFDFMRDVENLNDVLQLQWSEMTKERMAQERIDKEQMVVDYLAGECEHPI